MPVAGVARKTKVVAKRSGTTITGASNRQRHPGVDRLSLVLAVPRCSSRHASRFLRRFHGRRPPRHGAVHQFLDPRCEGLIVVGSTPVPSDLEIARSVAPRPILDVAHELGLRDDEVELYGNAK